MFFHASLQRVLCVRISTEFLLDAAVPPMTPSLSEPCSLILQFFLFDVNLSSTPQPLASLLRHSSSQTEACRDRPSTLPAQFGVTLQALSVPSGQLQSLSNAASSTFFSFSSSMDLRDVFGSRFATLPAPCSMPDSAEFAPLCVEFAILAPAQCLLSTFACL